MADYSTDHDSLETSSWSLPQRHGKEQGPDKCGTRETSEIKRAFLFHIFRSSRFFSSTTGLGRQPTYPPLGAQVAHSAYCLMICKGQTWWRGVTGTSWVISKILQYPLPLHFWGPAGQTALAGLSWSLDPDKMTRWVHFVSTAFIHSHIQHWLLFTACFLPPMA